MFLIYIPVSTFYYIYLHFIQHLGFKNYKSVFNTWRLSGYKELVSIINIYMFSNNSYSNTFGIFP